MLVLAYFVEVRLPTVVPLPTPNQDRIANLRGLRTDLLATRGDMLEVQVEAWAAARNREGARIRWMFGIDDARRKMGHLYPTPFYDTVLPLAA